MGASLSEFQTKILPKVFVRGGLTHAHATSQAGHPGLSYFYLISQVVLCGISIAK
jgi:hypothetical protein